MIITRNDIHHFLTERASYEAAIAMQPNFKPLPRWSFFKEIFLFSLLHAHEFYKETTEFIQITDNLIKAKIVELSSRFKNVTYEEAMANFKWKFLIEESEPDSRIRIIMLRTNYIALKTPSFELGL